MIYYKDPRYMSASKDWHDSWGDWPRRNILNDTLMWIERFIYRENLIASLEGSYKIMGH